MYFRSIFAFSPPCLYALQVPLHPILAPRSCSFSSYLCAARAPFPPTALLLPSLSALRRIQCHVSLSFLATNSYPFRALFPAKHPACPIIFPASLIRVRPSVLPNAPHTSPSSFSCTKKAPIARCFLLSVMFYTSRSIFGKKSAKVTFASSIGGRL